MLLLTFSHPAASKKQLHSEQKQCCMAAPGRVLREGSMLRYIWGLLPVSDGMLSLQSTAQKDVVAMPQWRCCGLSWEWCRFQL